MTTTAQIDAFLACKRIGFAGVSSEPQDFSRAVFRELVARGYDVVPIHLTANEIEGRPAYSTVVDAAPLDAVYIMTPAAATESIVRDCHHAGVKRVWVHRGVGKGSVDWHAWQYADAHGIELIDGECIMMFLPHTQAVHRAHGEIRRVLGHYPDIEPRAHRWRTAIGYGAIAWLLATWAMLVISGVFNWDIGLSARFVVVPASFAGIARLHAGPGRLAPLATAIVFTLTSVFFDVLIIAGLVQRGFTMSMVTWLPIAIGFVAAVIAGTRHVSARSYAAA